MKQGRHGKVGLQEQGRQGDPAAPSAFSGLRFAPVLRTKPCARLSQARLTACPIKGDTPWPGQGQALRVPSGIPRNSCKQEPAYFKGNMPFREVPPTGRQP